MRVVPFLLLFVSIEAVRVCYQCSNCEVPTNLKECSETPKYLTCGIQKWKNESSQVIRVDRSCVPNNVCSIKQENRTECLTCAGRGCNGGNGASGVQKSLGLVGLAAVGVYFLSFRG